MGNIYTTNIVEMGRTGQWVAALQQTEKFPSLNLTGCLLKLMDPTLSQGSHWSLSWKLIVKHCDQYWVNEAVLLNNDPKVALGKLKLIKNHWVLYGLHGKPGQVYDL